MTARQAVAAAEPLNDVHRLGTALGALAEIQRLQGELEAAGTNLTRLAGLVEDSGKPAYVPAWERTAVRVALCQGDPAGAITWARREGRARGASGDASLTLDTQLVLATALLANGQAEAAREVLGGAEQAARAMSLPGALADAAELRASLADAPEQQLALHHEALRTRSGHRLVPGAIDSLEAIAVLLVARDQEQTACILAAAARGARENSGNHGPSPVADRRAALDALLGASGLAAAVTHVAGLTLWEAAEHAARSRAPAGAPSPVGRA